MRLIQIDPKMGYQCVALSREEANSLIQDLVGQLADVPGAGSKTYYLNGEEVGEARKQISFMLEKK